ncbi:hypothetical protein JMA_19050 [Jeotgalibacillus malaysiensis]|uniref:Uncharacterized protein n=1 Tax=Jeotgalibacillus malaysiensis TaxID=1508404 RepID=A0A0B5ARE9_9BACL|nr:hypothetical protein [Jeotgalibacillus malaysiensis]AJD91222.1 hypothetical protein JMA_19050 [Jeotgalibacillus malaysiensis]
MTDKNLLLELYASLWNNRSYNSFEQMEQSILSELTDQNTHPRLRRSPKTKLQITLQMIRQSKLNAEEQNMMIEYITLLYNQNFNK